MMKKWKSGVSILMAAAMIMGNITIAVPVKAEPAAGLLVNGGFEEEVFNDDSEKQVFVCQCKFGY